MQSKISAPLLSALSLSGLAFAQNTNPVPLPDIGVQTVTCGGCYAVAGVAGIIFGPEVFTATQVNGMVAGLNTTVTTSFALDTAQFTIQQTGVVAGPVPTNLAGETSFDLRGSTYVIGGQTLTSPTAYNVFTAYSTTSTTLGPDGSCSIVLGTPIPINPVISIPIPSTISDAAGFSSFQLEAESRFFQSLGGLPRGCSGGGVAFTPTTQVSITITTVNVTTTMGRTLTPAPASTVSATPTSTAVITSDVGTGTLIANSVFSNASFTIPTPGQGTIVLPQPTVALTSTLTNTIVEAGANRQSALGALLSGVLAMIVGFAA